MYSKYYNFKCPICDKQVNKKFPLYGVVLGPPGKNLSKTLQTVDDVLKMFVFAEENKCRLYLYHQFVEDYLLDIFSKKPVRHLYPVNINNIIKFLILK